jgi:hypothetical protein
MAGVEIPTLHGCSPIFIPGLAPSVFVEQASSVREVVLISFGEGI